MKTLLLLALSLLPATAEIIGVEQFDYPDGPIATKDGGTFWDYKNFTPTGHTGFVSNWDNVTGAPSVASGRLVTNNSGAKREYHGTPESDGAVNDPASAPSSVSKKVYYRVDVTTGATVPDSFGLSSYDFGTEKLFFGKRSGQPKFGIGEVGVSGTDSTTTPDILPDTTYTLVARIDYAANIVSLHVNPDLNAAEPSPAASRSYTGTNWSTAVRLASGTGGSAVAWDELVVATTWEDLGTVVTTTADEDNGNLSGNISLREAVEHSPPGSLITFAPGLNGRTCTLSLGEMRIDKDLTIDASALANGVTIDANLTSRHFFIAGGASLTLKSLSLVNGNGVGDSGNFGGAIVLFTGNLFLQRCTLSGNFAGSAGAIWLQGGGNSRLEECTLTGNRATGAFGTGGIIAFSGNCTLSRCTLSGNTGTSGGGGLFLQSPANVSLSNCIIAGNTDSDAHDILRFDGTLTASGSNLIGSNATVSGIFPPGPLVGTQASPLDPRLSPLGHFGGSVRTLHPLIGSPAIDAADTTDPGGTDARGFPRFLDGNGDFSDQTDIGAVEAGPGAAFPVNTLADEDDGDLFPIFGAGTSLRESVKHSPAGSIIVFDPALAGQTITLTLGELAIPATPGLFIDASNLTAPVTVSGNHAGRVFNIPATATVAIRSLEIINGKTPDGAATGQPGGNGGGILNAGTLSLFHSTIAHNRTGNGSNSGLVSGAGSGGDGGGIFSSGPLHLNACTISGNTTGNGGNADGGSDFADPGGGGGAGGGIFSNGPLSLTACTLSGNATGDGGNSSGIHPEFGPESGGSGGDGGAIRKNDDIPYRLTACTIAGNRTGEGGDGPGGKGFAGFGGGVSSGALISQDSVFARNAGFRSSPDVHVISLTTLGANLLGTAASSFEGGGPAPIIDPDPLLAPLGDYGGPTRTMLPLPGSPAIDGAAASHRTTDQRGFPISGIPDIGAVEAQPALSGFIDTDSDGMDDRLEPFYGFTVGIPDGHLDADGDGSPNRDELGNMTGPRDPDSLLKILSFTRSGTNVTFTWTSFPGLSYKADYSGDLGFGNTLGIGTATGMTTTQTIGPIYGPKGFLRIRRN